MRPRCQTCEWDLDAKLGRKLLIHRKILPVLLSLHPRLCWLRVIRRLVDWRYDKTRLEECKLYIRDDVVVEVFVNAALHEFAKTTKKWYWSIIAGVWRVRFINKWAEVRQLFRGRREFWVCQQFVKTIRER